MARRLAVVITLSLLLGVVAFTGGVAGAKKVAFAASGDAACRATVGSVKFKPGLTAAPHPATISLKATLTCSVGTTGQSGVTIVSGKLTGSSGPTNLSCSAGSLGPVRSTVKWKAPGAKLLPTTVVWSGGTLAVGAGAIVDLPAASSTLTGSYAGKSSNLHLVAAGGPGGACTTKKGWKGFATDAASTTFDATVVDPPEDEEPEPDDFYTPPVPLPPGTPGDIIRSEPIALTSGPAVDAWRVLYRSTSATGAPIAVSGTIIVPTAPFAGTRPLLALAPPTRGNGDQCATSKQVAAGSAPDAFAYNQPLTNGWAVAIPDYEGLGTPSQHTYLVGRSQGRATLDAARAATRLSGTGLSLASPLALFGYSQGGQSAAWAGELQPTYAPELPLVGVAAGGVPADPEQLATGLEGTPDFAFAASLLIGYDAAYPELDLDTFLTPEASVTFAETATGCYPGYAAALGSLTIDDVTTSNPLATAAWQSRLAQNTLGGISPTVPVHLWHGTGDTIVARAQATDLVTRYCDADVVVDYQSFPGANHFLAYPFGLAPSLSWISDRFAGLPAPDTCP